MAGSPSVNGSQILDAGVDGGVLTVDLRGPVSFLGDEEGTVRPATPELEFPAVARFAATNMSQSEARSFEYDFIFRVPVFRLRMRAFVLVDHMIPEPDFFAVGIPDAGASRDGFDHAIERGLGVDGRVGTNALHQRECLSHSLPQIFDVVFVVLEEVPSARIRLEHQLKCLLEIIRHRLRMCMASYKRSWDSACVPL